MSWNVVGSWSDSGVLCGGVWGIMGVCYSVLECSEFDTEAREADCGSCRG